MCNRNRLSDQLEFYQPTLLLFIPIQELNIVGSGYFIVQQKNACLGHCKNISNCCTVNTTLVLFAYIYSYMYLLVYDPKMCKNTVIYIDLAIHFFWHVTRNTHFF